MISRPLLLSVLVLVGAGLLLAAATFWTGREPDPAPTAAVPATASDFLPDGDHLALAEIRATDITEEEPAQGG